MTAWTNVMANESSCTAIQSSTGLGKSTMMRKHAGNFIIELRANGDTRSVVVFVPTINLAREQMFKFREQFPTLTAECYIGLDRYNPNKTNIKMCERTEAKSLIEKGIAISNLCGSKQSTEWCSHHINSGCDYPCGYSQQQHIHADIWFMAHQKLFTPKPLNIDPIAVIIDETFWEASIGNKLELNLSSLTTVAISPDYEKACEIVIPYLTQAHDGYLDVERVRSNSNQALAECYKASDELKSYYSNKVSPSMTPHAVKQILENIPSKSIISFWRVLAAALKSGVEKTPYLEKLSKNNNDCLIRLTEKKNIHADWGTETLLLDATLSISITKLYFSELNTQVIESPMSNTTVTQISDVALSKKMMLPDQKSRDKKNAERIINLGKLISILRVRVSSISNGVKVDGYDDSIKILLVTNKAIEEALIERKDLPKGVATMHYGATSGIDIYKDVPSLAIAGRIMLSGKQTEERGSLLKGEVVISDDSNESWYSKRVQTIKTKSTEVSIEADYHTDPIVEEVRFQKTVGEIIQAIGRGRGLRRNKSNPLDILILTNVPTLPNVDLLTTWPEVVPTKLEVLLTNNKITPLSHNELVRLFPNQIKTTKTARTAVNNFFKRYSTIKDVVKSNLSDLLPIYSIIREKGTQFQHYKELRLVRYTRKAKGAKPCFAVIFDIEANEIEKALTALVGELKSYKYICAFSADGEALP
ncbi:MAG: putative DNA primase/helicase [Oleiphilaceae bacterium]|jgi:putative DNA primase/helicase